MKKKLLVFVYLVLVLTAVAVYRQVTTFGFVNYDDPGYVSQNPNVQAGISGRGVVWAFTALQQYNWHPLVWLSLMLDCSLFGPNPHWCHFTNLLLHVINALLLFAVFRQMTGVLWPSAFVAAAFALHPMHVESVAWISERKDVLSTFFWILTTAAYYRYAKNPTTGRYILAIVLFAFGLMSKPMLVTLPFVLLLLDYWPLNRFGPKFFWPLLLEKIPFFVLSIISCVITFIAQKLGGAVISANRIPFDMRISNAVIAYVKYIVKLFWPTRLAFYYPYPAGKFPYWQITGAVLVLLFVSALAIYLAKKYKYLFVGWLWFLGTLVPVIGLVQVGEQTMADRYTYIPFIGLFIIIAWALADLSANWPYRKIILGAFALIIFPVLFILTGRQVGFWRSNDALLTHALDVTSGNYLAHNNLGVALLEQGKFAEAMQHFQQAISIRPLYPDTFNNIGACYNHLGRYQDATRAYKKAIEIKPDYSDSWYNLGANFFQIDRYHDAINAFNQALKIKPDDTFSHFGLGLSYLRTGDKDSAVKEYEILGHLDPQLAQKLLGYINK